MVFLFLLLSISIFSLAQSTKKSDSLLLELKRVKEDTSKVNLLFNIGETYDNTKPEIAKKYYNEALKLSKKTGYKLGEIKYAFYYTSVLNNQGEFTSSLKINRSAMQLANQINNPLMIIKSTINTANSYNLLNKNDSAIYYYMKTLPKLEKLGNKRMLGIVYNNLSKMYADLNQFSKSIEYGKKGIETSRVEKDSLSLEYGLVNLGVSFCSLNDLKFAEQSFNEALKISDKINDNYAKSAILINIADISYKKGDYNKSLIYNQRALKIAKKIGLFESQTIALRGHAMYYLQNKNYDLAKRYVDSSLVISEKNNIRIQILKNLQLLSDISYVTQDLRTAKKYDEKIDMLQDSINADNLKEITTNYEQQYESEKKDSQIKLQKSQLKQKSIFNYILLASAFFLIAILFLTYRNYNQRKKLQLQKINELETEKQLLATQSLLKGQEEERSRLAKDLHDGLGGLLSGVKLQLGSMKGDIFLLSQENKNTFDRALLKLDESIDEMRRVAHNMMPESLLKFGLKQAILDYCDSLAYKQDFDIHCELHGIDMKMNNSTEVILYRIIQELVNNAIKHSQATTILVQVLRDENGKIFITIEDNGKGFDVQKINLLNSAGMRSVQSRVNYLKGTIDIKSVVGKGTSIFVECNEEKYG